MTFRRVFLATVSALALFMSVPPHVHGQQAQALQPPVDMASLMARMQNNDATLDALLKRMIASVGEEKQVVMEQLLTALVDDRRNACEPMMAQMMTRMNATHGQSHR
jgi:hypothetical protein